MEARMHGITASWSANMRPPCQRVGLLEVMFMCTWRSIDHVYGVGARPRHLHDPPMRIKARVAREQDEFQLQAISPRILRCCGRSWHHRT
jgi:hypothetical protein